MHIHNPLRNVEFMHSPSINYIGIEDIHRGINVILYDFWDIEQGLQGEEMSILKDNMNVILSISDMGNKILLYLFNIF